MAVITATAALLVLLAGRPGAASAAAAPVRIGLVVETSWPESQETADAFRAAFRGAVVRGRAVEFVERTLGPDAAGAPPAESDVRAVLAELAIDGAEVVVSMGDRTALTAPEAVRDRPVVTVSSDGSLPAGQRGGRVFAVAATVDPARLAEELRRLAPGARRATIVAPPCPVADALRAALDRLAGRAVAVERIEMPNDAAAARVVLGSEIVAVSRTTPASQVVALARAMSGQGAPLVGTRLDHLDAGAAVVLRTSAADVGGLAAAACATALADWSSGDSRAEDAPRRPRRLLREVNLGNARRLGFEIPLAILASSDRTVAPAPERR